MLVTTLTMAKTVSRDKEMFRVSLLSGSTFVVSGSNDQPNIRRNRMRKDRDRIYKLEVIEC